MKAVHALQAESGELALMTAMAIPSPLPKRTRQDVENALTATLLESASRKPPLRDLLGSSRVQFEIVKDQWGKPALILTTGNVLSVSYSRGAERLWAALACGEFSVGIDVAEFRGFEAGYPLERAFGEREWSWAVSTTGDRASAAALLWASKEAVVKALGCGFHFIEPLSLEVMPRDDASTRGWTAYSVAVRAPGPQSSLEVAARALDGAWCCLARAPFTPGSPPPWAPVAVATTRE